MQQDIKKDRIPGIYMKKILHNRQVTGTAHRQKLRQSLDNAQKHRLQ